MPLALVCFFFEADAAELAKEAGREATQLYCAEHGHVPKNRVRGPFVRKSLSEKLEDTLLHISKLVDPIEISRVVKRLEDLIYQRHYQKVYNRKRCSEAWCNLAQRRGRKALESFRAEHADTIANAVVPWRLSDPKAVLIVFCLLHGVLCASSRSYDIMCFF